MIRPQRPTRLPLLTAFILTLATGSSALACGGFFCSTFPMNQVAERILFVVGEGVVSTHVQIQYNGDAPDFAWILPVPSPPDLQVTHNEVFRQLQFATQPSFQLNFDEDEDCGFFFFATVEMDDASRADGGVQVVSEERVGPYDTVVVTADDAASITTWLTDNNYNLGELGAQLLQPYVDEGYYFVALRLAADREVGDLQPIALTYPADKPGIPIRLTAVATAPNLGVLAWILGTERAIPSNYLHVEINEARIDWFNGGFNYPAVVTEAANEAGGQAFATDYAGPSQIMRERIFQEGRFDLDRLRTIEDPVEFIDQLLRQGFPRDAQMQALLRRHIPMTPRVLEEGVLQVMFGGDVEAYQAAEQDGWLPAAAEQSFYNNLAAYEEWIEDEFDLAALADEIGDVIVEPLRAAQDLFGDFPYLTRLYTTLSAEEMTVDPMFSFNPDLPDVSNFRMADARWECPEGKEEDPQEVVLVVTLSDGREIRSRPFGDQDPEIIRSLQPAASLVQRIDESGPPEILLRTTAIADPDNAAPLPDQVALLPNYPNPFNAGTVIPFSVPADLPDLTLFTMQVYNLLGQPVRTLFAGYLQPGLNRLEWDGKNDAGEVLPSGPYLYRLHGGGTEITRKLLVVR